MSVVAVVAQVDSGTAPVVWERYKFTNTAISIMLPKMPVALNLFDLCHQVTKDSYFAYADNAVYELTVVEKSYAEFPHRCVVKVPFGKSTLADRIAELHTAPEKSIETTGSKYGYHFNKFAADGDTRWILDDLENHRWIEVDVAKRADSTADEDKFFDSLMISMDLKNTPGKQVSLGADRTLGDADLKPPEVKDQPKTAVTDPLRIIIHPRASYTDDARKKMTQGTVRLKVVLLANGGIGGIEVAQPLEGLTDQAIAAARKIVFLPKRVNGVNISVVKMIEYNFNIY